MSKIISIIALSLFLVLHIGCQSTPENNDKPTKPFVVGQYSIIQVKVQNNKGTSTPFVIKLNTSTGETWILKNDDIPKWIIMGSENDPLGILGDSLQSHRKRIPTNEEIDKMSKEQLEQYLKEK
jgi:hypothetical protein